MKNILDRPRLMGLIMAVAAALGVGKFYFLDGRLQDYSLVEKIGIAVAYILFGYLVGFAIARIPVRKKNSDK